MYFIIIISVSIAAINRGLNTLSSSASPVRRRSIAKTDYEYEVIITTSGAIRT